MPYTVQFEVGPQAVFDADIAEKDATASSLQSKAKQRSNSAHSGSPIPQGIPQGIPNQSSILPSLSIANSQLQSPANSSPKTNDRRLSNDSRGYEKQSNPGGQSPALSSSDVEQFFYLHHKSKKFSGDNAPHNPLTDNLNEKLASHYIQPRSRYNQQVPSLVVDPKNRKDDDIGFSGLKISRSKTDLPNLNSSTSSFTNLIGGMTPSTPAASSKPRSALSRANFTLHGNSSHNSLAIAEEEEEEEKGKHDSRKSSTDQKPTNPNNEDLDDWKNNFNDVAHGRSETKLAPFGGFSNADLESGFSNQQNIFETAPWKIVLTDKGNGSLTKAVRLSVESGKIHNRKWVGTLSMPSDVVPCHVIDNIAQNLRDEFNSEAVFPNDITFQGHYKSFCKQILWPSLHYQIPDDPKSKAFEDHSWGHYKLLNQLVADKVVEVYKKENAHLDPNDPENIIWVHDYHLLLVPQMIREQLPNAKIGFFLHVSFPSSEVFRCFAQRTALLKGILGANCVSFQNQEYVRHFLQTCNRLLLADTNEFGITYDGKFTSITTIPVGIDANSLSQAIMSNEVNEWRKLIRERWSDQNLIVCRDKLDKLRGIKQKLLAYEKFLLENPEFVDTTVLIEICIGSSHDSSYESEIMQIVARINSLPENISVSQPVVLLQKDIDFDQYLALQCEAEVFVVSSMREGMNLTCHEFIIATTEKKSPLMLSEFTGSSQLLDHNGKGAILINPWDIKKFAEMFKYALTMNPAEKLERWRNCHDTVVTHDSKAWVVSCIDSINEAWDRDQCRHLSSLTPFTRDVFENFYNDQQTGTGKNIYFLNLETPSAISPTNINDLNKVAAGVSDPSKTPFSEPNKISKLLNGLLSDPRNQVYLISFMKRKDLEALYRTVPNLGLIAENGGYIKLIGSTRWVSIVDENELKYWMPQVRQLIEAKAERLIGSHCEVEDCTVRFHPGTSIKEDRERSLDTMGDTIQHINDVFGDRDGVHAALIKNVVVVQQDHLCLKALKFIVSYYNHKSSGTPSKELIEEYQVKRVPSSVPTTPSAEHHPDDPIISPIASPANPNFPRNSPFGKVSSKSPVSSVFFSGGSTRIDDPSFEYVNNLKESGEVDNVLTITVLGADTDVRTSAYYRVAGKNELLGILSNTDAT